MSPPDEVHARRVEKIVAACFILAFIAGCGFIAAYVGLEVHSVDATLRSNLALGTSLSVALAALGLGALLWVRHLMPDVEVVEERHELRSEAKDRRRSRSTSRRARRTASSSSGRWCGAP